jgi:hypothetical protein
MTADETRAALNERGAELIHAEMQCDLADRVHFAARQRVLVQTAKMADLAGPVSEHLTAADQAACFDESVKLAGYDLKHPTIADWRRRVGDLATERKLAAQFENARLN